MVEPSDQERSGLSPTIKEYIESLEQEVKEMAGCVDVYQEQIATLQGNLRKMRKAFIEHLISYGGEQYAASVMQELEIGEMPGYNGPAPTHERPNPPPPPPEPKR